MKDRAKRDDAPVRESEEDPFRKTFDQAALGVAYIGADGRWLRINPGLCTLLGYSEEEMRARTLEDILQPDDLPEDLAQIRRMLAGELDGMVAERRYRRKNGPSVWVQQTVFRARTSSEEPAYLVAFIEDIRARKERAEEQALLLIEAQWNAAADHALLRTVLASVTEGRLRLCNGVEDLPVPLIPVGELLTISAQSLWTVRRRTQELAISQGFALDRWQDLVMAVGAAAVNAVTQAGNGEIRFYAGTNGTLQVWIEDMGPGIAADYQRAESKPGEATAAWVPRQEFWTLLKSADRAFLLTGASGTTVVLEQDRANPEPDPLIELVSGTGSGIASIALR